MIKTILLDDLVVSVDGVLVRDLEAVYVRFDGTGVCTQADGTRLVGRIGLGLTCPPIDEPRQSVMVRVLRLMGSLVRRLTFRH